MTDPTRRRLDVRPAWVAGRPVDTGRALDVFDPFTAAVTARVALATDQHVEQALQAAEAARRPLAAVGPEDRARGLEAIAAGIDQDRAAFVDEIVREGGKPRRWAVVEVNRAIETFGWSAGEARRRGGEIQEIGQHGTGSTTMVLIRRLPVGVVVGITPFNYPINLVAHKVGPSIAVGAPIILKPSSATPSAAIHLAEIVGTVGLPAGTLSVLPMDAILAERMIADRRVAVVSFTGSPAVGWRLKAIAAHASVLLELGGNAACVLLDDADLAHAVERIAFGGFHHAGQSCISVQRILVASGRYQEFAEALVERVTRLHVGDPDDIDTDVGPLIDATAMSRIRRSVDAAVGLGGRVMIGGRADGPCYLPTIMADVPRDADAWAAEIFGPVVAVASFESFEQAIATANDSRFGLQAGVFTRDLSQALRAFSELEVGGVVINDVPSFRADPMPYGGWKESGFGREGVRWAMDEMTAMRTMIIPNVAP